MMQFKRLLIPLDGSPLAEKALPVALALAQKFDSEIILLQAVDIPPSMLDPVEYGSVYWLQEAMTQFRTEAETYLKDKETFLREQGYNVRTLVREAAPAQEIIHTADEEKVDMIVMSTHGRGGVARWTFGSVADKVARYCSCPVLLVREGMHLENNRSLEEPMQEPA
jgi:nucleotide-binding universal stress UspA family protein